MDVATLQTPMVYVVRWPDGLVKAGHSVHPSMRVKRLTSMGGELVATRAGGTEVERTLLDALAVLGTRAFATIQEAQIYFGGIGSGFTEFYRLTDDQFERFLNWLEVAVP